jgi:hypothetical protein
MIGGQWLKGSNLAFSSHVASEGLLRFMVWLVLKEAAWKWRESMHVWGQIN